MTSIFKLTLAEFKALKPRPEMLAFAKACDGDMRRFWNTCPNGEWLLWLLQKTQNLDDVNHRAVGREIDREFEQERFVVLHPLEIPSQAECIERRVKDCVRSLHIHRKGWTQIALGGHGAANHAFAILIVFNLESIFYARPLTAQFGIRFDGEFVLGILALRFDEIFVGAFLDVEFVVGHRRADGFVRRFRQQFNEQPVMCVQTFPFFQNGQAILQHILKVKRPERRRHKHPVLKRLQRLNYRRAVFRLRRVIRPENTFRPLRPVIGAGLEFFQVAFESGGHDFYFDPQLIFYRAR